MVQELEPGLRQIRKTTKKKHMWKRIPHLMQQQKTPRKGYSTSTLHELIKSNHYPKKNKVGEH